MVVARIAWPGVDASSSANTRCLTSMRSGIASIDEVDVAETVEGDAVRAHDLDAGGLDRRRDLARPRRRVPTTAALNTNMAPTLAVALGGELVGEARERALPAPAAAGAAATTCAPGRASPWSRTSKVTVIRVRTPSVSKRTRCTPRTRSSSNASACPSPAAYDVTRSMISPRRPRGVDPARAASPPAASRPRASAGDANPSSHDAQRERSYQSCSASMPGPSTTRSTDTVFTPQG